MKAVIQRVTYSNLSIDNKIYSQINSGLVVLIGITHDAVSYTHLTLPTRLMV